MNILLIGSGGREHALAWSLSRPLDTMGKTTVTLHCAPGNPGIASLATCHAVAVDDINALLALAKQIKANLTVVGPELPLSKGIVDAFEAEGLIIFGPSKAAAQLEASKAFAKQIMQAANVPTGQYFHAMTEADAYLALANFTPPYVIKEDGLAAGKGVTVTPDPEHARLAIKTAFAKGMTVVIEAFLAGEELSVLAICDGSHALPLVTAQDFKRAYDNDEGPNTGGMGAYAPVPWVTPSLMQQIQHQVLQPVLNTMAQRNTPYKGVLYAGLMISPEGVPNVIEFNARFGDPETQVVLPLLGEPLAPLLMAAATGNLQQWVNKGGITLAPDQCAVTVVLAAKGYPDNPVKGDRIITPDELHPQQALFHAGTVIDDGQQLLTHGGRVLNAVGFGATVSQARQQAYQLANEVQFEGKHFRQDIAKKAIEPVTI